MAQRVHTAQDQDAIPTPVFLSVVMTALHCRCHGVVSSSAQVKSGAIDMETDAVWAGVSGAAKAFVRLLLTRDTRARPSAAAALQHPWLVRQQRPCPAVGSGSVTPTVVASLRRFADQNSVKVRVGWWYPGIV